MVSKVLGIKTPKPDPAIAENQKKQADLLAQQEASAATDKKALQEKQNAALNANRKRKAGYRSLLSGLETGTDSSGGGTRATLG